MTKRILPAALLLLMIAAVSHAAVPGDAAAPFIGSDASGSTLWVKRYFGKKVILLSFDSTLSIASAEGLREIERVRALFPADQLQVLSVNLDANSPARIRNFYAFIPEASKYPVILDDQWAIARQYGIESIPTQVVIDKKGVIRYVSEGAGGKALEAAIADAIAGKKFKAPKPKKKGAPEAGPPAVRLTAPDAFTKTLTGMITVAGTAPEGSKLTVAMNGGTPRPVEMRGDTFFIRQPLTLASNFIEVEAKDNTGVRRKQGIMVFREADAGTGIVSNAPDYRFHTDANEAPCRKCHDVTPDEEKAKGLDSRTNPCLSCHQEMSGRKVVHGPIAIGGCSSCHRFKGPGERYGLVLQGAELCFECHDEVRSAITRQHQHEPAAQGRCTGCHDPHGSPEKFQLRRYVSDLCYSCHTDTQPLGGKSIHDPYSKGRCDMCHAPHGSDRDEKFLRLPGDRLCLSCHGDLPKRGHVHPSGKSTHRKLPEGIRLDDSGRLLCMSCHEAHEADEIKLLQKGGCDRCHEKMF